jgi:hypothetical protein
MQVNFYERLGLNEKQFIGDMGNEKSRERLRKFDTASQLRQHQQGGRTMATGH